MSNRASTHSPHKMLCKFPFSMTKQGRSLVIEEDNQRCLFASKDYTKTQNLVFPDCVSCWCCPKVTPCPKAELQRLLNYRVFNRDKDVVKFYDSMNN
ncbi:hypothetical protein FKM82_002015 [Ascaphus truei]